MAENVADHGRSKILVKNRSKNFPEKFFFRLGQNNLSEKNDQLIFLILSQFLDKIAF